MLLWSWVLFVATPFFVGVVVGSHVRSSKELLQAPPVAAALAPLPWALMAAIYGEAVSSNPLLGFLVWWVMLFPVVLILGAIPALGGGILGYWFNQRRLVRARRKAHPSGIEAHLLRHNRSPVGEVGSSKVARG